jgi:3-oxoacyl-[acyl-carrier protein] reductase
MGERKTAIVTGSATGIGAATALALAQRGYDVLINYSKSEAEAHETQAACRAAGADTLLLRGNVAEDADCRAMVQAAHKRWKRLDALVNNAGISVFGKDAGWDALDAQAFQRILGVNVLGTFQMVRACVPALKAARGCVVNVSSVAGSLGIGSSMPYIASKGAVNSMTLHLARELAPDIRVNAVCPGLVTTRWFVDGIGQEGFEKVKAAYESGVPLQRACSPQDVAEAIVWLVDGARSVTGELLLLDGGIHLGSRQVQAAARSD